MTEYPVAVVKHPHLQVLGYHEDIATGPQMGDVIGRLGNGATTSWIPLSCNNTLCGGLWLLNAARAHELIKEPLP